jgi:hypothetical protein
VGKPDEWLKLPPGAKADLKPGGLEVSVDDQARQRKVWENEKGGPGRKSDND